MSGEKFCYYCERPLQYGMKQVIGGQVRTKDHIIPKIKGGCDRKINKVECCSRCNGLKGGDLPHEFAERLQVYISKGKQKGPFKVDMLRLIYCNLQKLIVEVVEKHFEELFIQYNKPHDPTKHKAKSIVGSYLERHAGDINLSVNNNTSRQKKEEILFLQSQTIEQFREIYKK